MNQEQKFLIIKDKNTKEVTYFEYDKLSGYSLTSKQNVRFADAIDINKMIIINPTMIEKLVDKKVKRRFEKFINLITIVCEDNDQSGSGYMLALNEAEKFRQELINKYKQYIEEEKFELLLRKISILEDELNLRLRVIENAITMEEEMNKEGKSR